MCWVVYGTEGVVFWKGPELVALAPLVLGGSWFLLPEGVLCGFLAHDIRGSGGLGLTSGSKLGEISDTGDIWRRPKQL